ncbi:MAG: site-2 protease family protein [Egibacteraceae bacterium]
MSASSRPTPPKPAAPTSFPGAWTLFRVRGVPVRVDTSWFLIAGVVLIYVYNRLGQGLADHGAGVVLVSSAVATLLFFGSILAHELGHALASLGCGIPVAGITLFLMGGVTESTKEAASARDEFVIVGIGPFVSLVLAALFGLVATASGSFRPVAVVAGILGWLNLALAIFNVLPGYPLDGGRMLRSILWGVSRRPHQATRWAARVGQLFALTLGLYGLWRFAGPERGTFGGVWEILLAWFLFRGATDSHRAAQARERLARRTVREAMGSIPEPLPADLPLSQAARRVQERPSLLWPVGVPLVGVVGLEQIDAVQDDDWPSTMVGQVALPLEGRMVPADTPMDTTLEALSAAPEHMLVVTENGRAVGLLTPSLAAGQ